MRFDTVPELDAELAEVRQHRADALDRIVDDMLVIVGCDMRADVILDRRTAATVGVPVAQR